MSKIGLIIEREYLTRVKKKSFILMTILGPILLAGVMILAVWLTTSQNETQNILVVDENYPFFEKLEDTEKIKFSYSEIGIDEAKKVFHHSDYTSILFLPKNILSSNLGVMYFKKQPSLSVQKSVENRVEKITEELKLEKFNINKEDFYKAKTNFAVTTFKYSEEGKEEKVSPEVAAVGFVFSVFIYIFIFMYGSQVMRGVIEEKTSRIVEVIISSVKPFELMMGKIIGVAMVGLTQFLLWIIFTGFLFTAAQFFFFKDFYDVNQIQQSMQMTPEVMEQVQQQSALTEMNLNDPSNLLNRINFPLMTGMFLFYFLGGYLLYSALFAAIGAAVDSETDSQQFVMPVTVPLIFAYIASASMMENPESATGVWLSIIPFTSPVVMMIRVAIGIEPADMWQLYLSMALLILGFVFTTWVAARIYRTGILMYGKKATWKELWKWLNFKG